MDREEDIVSIVSKQSSDLSTKIEYKGKPFYILTEVQGSTPVTIRTAIYLEGTHLETLKVTKAVKNRNELEVLIDSQQVRAIKKIKEEEIAAKARITRYREIKDLITKGALSWALDATLKALREFPEDPLLTSYHGYLVASVDNQPRKGVAICREALKRLEGTRSSDADLLYALSYLNLGRACLLGNLKSDAIEAFKKGLSHDPGNKELLSGLKKLGIRKRPVFLSLPRSHPLNKYAGIILSRLKLR